MTVADERRHLRMVGLQNGGCGPGMRSQALHVFEESDADVVIQKPFTGARADHDGLPTARVDLQESQAAGFEKLQ